MRSRGGGGGVPPCVASASMAPIIIGELASFAVDPLLEGLGEEDVAELAQPVRLPRLVRPGGLGVEVVPLQRRREDVSRAGNGHDSGIGALEQRRHQEARESEVPYQNTRNKNIQSKKKKNNEDNDKYSKEYKKKKKRKKKINNKGKKRTQDITTAVHA